MQQLFFFQIIIIIDANTNANLLGDLRLLWLGIYGLSLALHWITDPDLISVFSRPIQNLGTILDPLRSRLLQLFIEESARFDYQLKGFVKTNCSVHFDIPLPMLLGDD